MKTKLYYFSGTGNSLTVARDLAKELTETELISIAQAVKSEKISPACDKIGIIFPVYIWGPPLIIKEFVQKLVCSKDAYIFGIVTYGGMPGNTMGVLRDWLAQKQLTLSASLGIRMPGNYTPLYGAISLWKQRRFFVREKKKIKKFAEVIKNTKETGLAKNDFLTNFLFTALLYKYSAPYIHKMAKDFWVDDKCDLCGICEKVCPVDNIKIVDKKITWQEKCEQCLACFQWCPREAIQFGKKTVKRKRYRHPEVMVKDFIQ